MNKQKTLLVEELVHHEEVMEDIAPKWLRRKPLFKWGSEQKIVKEFQKHLKKLGFTVIDYWEDYPIKNAEVINEVLSGPVHDELWDQSDAQGGSDDITFFEKKGEMYMFSAEDARDGGYWEFRVLDARNPMDAEILDWAQDEMH